MTLKAVTKINAPNLPPFDSSAALSELLLMDEEEYSNSLFSNVDSSHQEASHIFVSSSRLDHVRLSGSMIPKSRFVDIYFDKCDLSNIELKMGKLTRVHFADCKLTGLKLVEGQLHDVVFEDCVCDLMQLYNSELKGVMFKNCRLNNADFRSCKMKDVTLRNCQLQDSELYGATLKNVDCRGSRLDGVKANAKDWKGAIIDYQQALDLADYFASVLGIRIVKD